MPFVKGHKINRGRKLTDKHKKKISDKCKGRSGRIKGCVPWNKGLKNCYTKNTLEAMSIAKKGKPLSLTHRKSLSKSHKGIKQSFKWRMNRRLSQLGEKGSNWQGGKVNKNRKIRYNFKWKEWRRKVFERDSYTCQDCGKKGGYLEPHHKKKVSEYPELAYNIDNGITYCLKCHIKNDPYRKQFTKKRKK